MWAQRVLAHQPLSRLRVGQALAAAGLCLTFAALAAAQSPPPSAPRSPPAEAPPNSLPAGLTGAMSTPPPSPVAYPKPPPFHGRPAYNRQAGGSEIGSFGAAEATHRELTQ
jgi:hypothetical protein